MGKEAGVSHGNRKVYESEAVAGMYATLGDLFPAERILLERLGSRLAQSRMLDVGVGGGRTAVHFAPRVREYLGVDYSSAMIAGCRRRFPDPPPGMRFAVADARGLSLCADGGFDVILFSYNGLDYIGAEDRERALRELRRVAAPGAWIAFSSHNLMSLGTPRPAPAGAGRLRAILRGWALRWLNGDLRSLRRGDHAIVHDDGCRFRLRTFYVRPSHQAAALAASGLVDVEVFGMDGRGLPPAALDACADEWLYYLARVP